MDQVGAQTEKLSSYETTRTRRSLVDENIHNGDSNDGSDEEFASSGFYVREKTVDKNSKNNTVDEKSNSSPIQNGQNGDSNHSETHGDDDSNDVVQKPSDAQDEGKTGTEDLKKDVQINGDTENETEQKSKTDSKVEEENNEDNPKITEKNDTEDSEVVENEDKEETEHLEELKPSDDKEEINDKAEEDLKESTSSDDKVEDNLKETKSGDDIEETDEKATEEEKDCELAEKKGDDTIDKLEKDKENCESDEKKEDNSEVPCADEKKEAKDGAVEEKGDKKDDTVEENKDTKDDTFEEKKDTKDDTVEEKKDDKVEEKKDDESKEDNEVIEVFDDEKEEENVTEKQKEKKTYKSKREEKGSSILKVQLEKTGQESENDEHLDREMDMDEDFDPSLLCPDISMDVDEAPVITNNDEAASGGGTTSPLPYEPMFSELVDEITGAEVQIDLTPEEMEMRRNMFGPDNPVQESKVHCTACNVHLGSALIGANNRFVHPLLKVLICKNCYHFYTSGEFEKDEDGSELYCRWCGQGGQVLCCSSCEFVFCKRCIRNNFGPKKFKEIRDSDDWNCFRCNPGQLSNLRAACAEFMEYYRNEMARVQSVCETNPAVMTTDHTKCCTSEKKPATPVPTRTTKRKRTDEDDPDYSPVQFARPEEPPKKKVVVSAGSDFNSLPSSISVRPLAPKPVTHQIIRPLIMQTGPRPSTSQPQVLKIGNTTFKVKGPGGPGYTVQKAGQAAQRTTVSPGFIKIVPQRMQTPRPAPTSYTVVSGTNSGKPTFTTVRPPPLASKPGTSTNMKHEWFEKTVRAAARVNSNLSYTLTQLNRQQSTAGSVEALAVVHNKLQEVLSTSINSLIQIRKNLRTEFIAGIKHYKFPPKTAPAPPATATSTAPIVVKDDDDVIFVNPAAVAKNLPPPPPLALSPAIRITKKSSVEKPQPKPSSSGNAITITSASANPPKGGFLKVRSFTSLQSVPSECITIPDDPPEDEDPLAIKNANKNINKKSSVCVAPAAVNDAPIVIDDDLDHLVYNVNDEPSAQIKKMMNMVVELKRSRVVDEILRVKGLIPSDKKEKNPQSDESSAKNGEEKSDKEKVKS